MLLMLLIPLMVATFCMLLLAKLLGMIPRLPRWSALGLSTLLTCVFLLKWFNNFTSSFTPMP